MHCSRFTKVADHWKRIRPLGVRIRVHGRDEMKVRIRDEIFIRTINDESSCTVDRVLFTIRNAA